MSSSKSKKQNVQKSAKEVVQAYRSRSSFKSDPSGSYTGCPKDDEKPEQDADDL